MVQWLSFQQSFLQTRVVAEDHDERCLLFSNKLNDFLGFTIATYDLIV